MFRWTLFWPRGFVLLSNWLIFKLRFQERNVMRFLIFLSEILPILKPYLPQTAENLRPTPL